MRNDESHPKLAAVVPTIPTTKRPASIVKVAASISNVSAATPKIGVTPQILTAWPQEFESYESANPT